MTEPLLHLGNVRLMVKGIGGRGRSKYMVAKALKTDPDFLSVEPDDPMIKHRLVERSACALYRSEQRPIAAFPVTGRGEVIFKTLQCVGVNRHISQLRAFTEDLEMRNAAAGLDGTDFEAH